MKFKHVRKRKVTFNQTSFENVLKQQMMWSQHHELGRTHEHTRKLLIVQTKHEHHTSYVGIHKLSTFQNIYDVIY